MSNKVTNYKCPACTGPMYYDGEKDRLQCDYCGSSFTVDDIEIRSGAGFLVVKCGSMLLMPALGKNPSAEKMKIYDNRIIDGLF